MMSSRSCRLSTAARAAALGLFALWASGCQDNAGPAPPAVVQPAAPAETDAERQVRTHAWWAEPLAPERLQWLVAEVRATDPGRTFIFDSRAHQNARMTTAAIREPVGVGEAGIPRPAWVSVRGGQRWTTEKALAELLAALDEAAERRAAGK